MRDNGKYFVRAHEYGRKGAGPSKTSLIHYSTTQSGDWTTDAGKFTSPTTLTLEIKEASAANLSTFPDSTVEQTLNYRKRLDEVVDYDKLVKSDIGSFSNYRILSLTESEFITIEEGEDLIFYCKK